MVLLQLLNLLSFSTQSIKSSDRPECVTGVLAQRAPLRHSWAGQLVAVSVVTPSHVDPGGEADQAREAGHGEAGAEAGHPQLARGWPQV